MRVEGDAMSGLLRNTNGTSDLMLLFNSVCSERNG